MLVTSREYKVMVDSTLFADRRTALAILLEDLHEVARALGLDVVNTFEVTDPKERTIVFLDTPDFTLRRTGFLLRQRVTRKAAGKPGKTEYTLKCRTEDRYIAAGHFREQAGGRPATAKFEEDIACPFASRFSLSTTVELEAGEDLTGATFPTTLAAATRLFPHLAELQQDERPCPPDLALRPVYGRHVWEQVFTGPEVRFPTPEDPSPWNAG